ncbi:universal stress protein [Actinomycetes bacterium KLBMP 9759]
MGTAQRTTRPVPPAAPDGDPVVRREPDVNRTVVVLGGPDPRVSTWCRSTGRARRAAPDGSLTAVAPRAALVDRARRVARTRTAVLVNPGATHSTRSSIVAGPIVAGPIVAGPIVAAVQRLPEDEALIVAAAECAAVTGTRLVILHAVPRSFGERSVGIAEALAHASAVVRDAAAIAAAAAPDVDVTTRVVRARPHEVVGEDLDASLLLVGGARSGHDEQLGLVTLSALHHAPCAVLIVPRLA